MNDHARTVVQNLTCPKCGQQTVKTTKTIQKAHMGKDEFGNPFMLPRKNYMACKSCGVEWYAENFHFVYWRKKRAQKEETKKEVAVVTPEPITTIKTYKAIDNNIAAQIIVNHGLNGQLSKKEQDPILDILRKSI